MLHLQLRHLIDFMGTTTQTGTIRSGLHYT